MRSMTTEAASAQDSVRRRLRRGRTRGRPEQADLPADLLERIQGAGELRPRVRGHERGADQRAARRRRRREHAVDEDALLLQPVDHPKRGEVFADDDRDDGSARFARVEAERPQPLREEPRVLPEPLAALGLRVHDLDGGEGGGGRRRRRRGREDERAGAVLDVVDDGGVAGDEAADRGHRLRERAHDEVDVVLEAEVLGGAASGLAEDADAVGVVDHHAGRELPGDGRRSRAAARCRPPSRRRRRRRRAAPWPRCRSASGGEGPPGRCA